MEELRKKIEETCQHYEAVNRSFANGEYYTNQDEYSALRECVGALLLMNCTVQIEEIWERGLVSCGMTIGGIKY